jgi:hypothetical protein
MELISSIKRREPPLRIPESMVKHVGDHVTFFFTREEFASLVRDHIDALKTNDCHHPARARDVPCQERPIACSACMALLFAL